ncbi:hypothetical protein Mnod_5395 [Methylobacterium nodulans ORS 2060]|uniref:Uncharacterized protein n=2 Tax=Methylobacterium nodulans TaxID=114616 RepID=B8IMP7_METNO|nr:hypothetical protein Mnod_5395 [Methylobacterium nodulans ORS 2060]
MRDELPPDHPDHGLSPENRRAMDRELAEAMTRAGIGKRYHTRKLEEFGDAGKSFKERMRTDLFRVLDDGGNLIVKGKKSYEFCMVMARAFTIVRRMPMVLPLVKVGTIFEERRYDVADTMEEAKVLIVTGFCDEGERPFAGWLGHKVEALLTARLDAQRPTVLQVEPPGTLHWWSGSFRDRFEITAETIEVK